MELLEMHEVVHAGEHEPFAAEEPTDQRMLERTGIGLVASHRPGAASDDALAAIDPTDERRSIRVRRPRDARHDTWRIRRP
jgi:hypothetical protein